MAEERNEGDVELDPIVFDLEDEDGESHEFAMLVLLDLEEGQVAVMAPVSQLDNDEDPAFDLYAFHYAEDEDGISLTAVEDDELIEKVFELAEIELFGEE